MVTSRTVKCVIQTRDEKEKKKQTDYNKDDISESKDATSTYTYVWWIIPLCCSNNNKKLINRQTQLYIYIILLYLVYSCMFRPALMPATIRLYAYTCACSVFISDHIALRHRDTRRVQQTPGFISSQTIKLWHIKSSPLRHDSSVHRPPLDCIWDQNDPHRLRPQILYFLWWTATQQKLRTHRSLEAYCSTLWWR
jgi:hypothetical protein